MAKSGIKREKVEFKLKWYNMHVTDSADMNSTVSQTISINTFFLVLFNSYLLIHIHICTRVNKVVVVVVVALETRVLQSRRSKLSRNVQPGLLVYLRFIKTRSGN